MKENQESICTGSWPTVSPDSRSAAVEGAEERVPIPIRLFEITVALTVLTLTLPVMAIVALIIRLDGKGPVLFRQTRLGKDFKPFTFVKFRTLYADARERFPEMYKYTFTDEEIEDFTFKLENDPRVTACGRWLRKSTLDELPNFWNVLKGDMALVGPRPEIPEMLPYYKGEMLKKFSVRPGITGLSQVRGRGHLKFLETAKYDVEYVETRSFLLDVRIILETIWKVVKRDGAH